MVAVNNVGYRETAAAAKRPIALRPKADSASTQAASSALALVTELAHLFVPDEAPSRRLSVTRHRDLELAEGVLAVTAAATDDDRLRRFSDVLGYCRDFADMCRTDPRQAVFWGPPMLEVRPQANKAKSAWVVLCEKVDAYRAERKTEAATRAAKAAERRADAASQAQRMDPVMVAEMAARITGRAPGAS